MDEQKKAMILVGASEVAGDRRHLYLLFQKSDGSQTVVRGGPDTRAEGNDLANFAESTLLGSEKFGHIRVEAAPYIAPYEIGYRLKQDGNYEPVPLNQLNPSEPALARDAKGNIVKATVTAPDWPAPGERHDRIVAWSGSDQELSTKLESALKAGDQINHAQLEYSPLYNNSNGVVTNLLKASGVQPVLPKNAQGETVNAPDLGKIFIKTSARHRYAADTGLTASSGSMRTILESCHLRVGSHWYLRTRPRRRADHRTVSSSAHRLHRLPIPCLLKSRMAYTGSIIR